MADSSKRGKDYNKRLNYDELKDKINKKKTYQCTVQNSNSY